MILHDRDFGYAIIGLNEAFAPPRLNVVLAAMIEDSAFLWCTNEFGLNVRSILKLKKNKQSDYTAFDILADYSNDYLNGASGTPIVHVRKDKQFEVIGLFDNISSALNLQLPSVRRVVEIRLSHMMVQIAKRYKNMKFDKSRIESNDEVRMLTVFYGGLAWALYHLKYPNASCSVGPTFSDVFQHYLVNDIAITSKYQQVALKFAAKVKELGIRIPSG